MICTRISKLTKPSLYEQVLTLPQACTIKKLVSKLLGEESLQEIESLSDEGDLPPESLELTKPSLYEQVLTLPQGMYHAYT